MARCGPDAGYVKGKEDSQRHLGCALGAASKAATIESAAALHACDIATVGADVRTHDQEPIHALPSAQKSFTPPYAGKTESAA